MDFFGVPNVLHYNKETLKIAAKTLRNDTLKWFELYSPKTLPPNVEDLCDDELKLPDSVTFF